MASTSEQGGRGKKKKHVALTNEKDESETTKIQPQDLKIAWGSDKTQWKIEKPKDEEASYAEAIKVMWFEVKATHKGAKAGSKYKIGFNISLTDDASGWENTPVFLMAKVGESGSYDWKRLYLSTKDKTPHNFPECFEVDVPSTADDTTLIFGLYEIWAGRWKRGMKIHHAFVTKI